MPAGRCRSSRPSPIGRATTAATRVDTSKLRGLGWTPQVAFEAGLAATVEWYRANEWWWRPIKDQDPAYRAYHAAQYGAGDSRPCARRSSPAPRDLPAATCSIASPDRAPVIGWHRPGTVPPGNRADTSAWRRDRHLATARRCAPPSRTPSRRGFTTSPARRASTPSWTNVVPHLEINVLGTHHLLDAVAQAGLDCRVLVVSSALVYAVGPDAVDESAPLRPSSPYGLSKLAQDELARRAAAEDGLDVVIARPFNHIGPRQEPGFAVSSFARQIALIEAGRAEPVIARRQPRREARLLTDVRDVVAAYEALMTAAAPAAPYNICSGQGTRIGDRARCPVRSPVSRSASPPNPTLLRPSDIPLFQGDATRIRNEVGWTPERSPQGHPRGHAQLVARARRRPSDSGRMARLPALSPSAPDPRFGRRMGREDVHQASTGERLHDEHVRGRGVGVERDLAAGGLHVPERRRET